MKAFVKYLLPIALFAGTFYAGHSLALSQYPRLVMSKAMTAMTERGATLNAGFALGPRLSPENQSIVRPSPDLAYSICRFDAREGPIEISGVQWPQYASLSIFNTTTDNIFVTSLDSRLENAPKGRVIIVAEGATFDAPTAPAQIIEMADARGLALIRRLAPDVGSFAQVETLSEGDICRPLGLA